jgi:DEAD/DEAH box helicase domain-containing protein
VSARVPWGLMSQSVHHSPEDVLARLTHGRPDRLRHIHTIPARAETTVDWPEWVPVELVEAWAARGIAHPWAHQVEAAETARAGLDVVLATGTASGKSLAFAMPALAAVHGGLGAANGRGSTVLYLSPTKALAHDQYRSLRELQLPWLRAATYDGDTSRDERTWARAHANYILTNPDLIHRSMLPMHTTWASFLRRLDVIVIDECHTYRGVFGAHISAVIRRLRRTCARYGANPVVIAASATVADPAASLERLIGSAVHAVTDDTSPRARKVIGLWQPAMIDRPARSSRSDGEPASSGGADEPVRRSATAETADLLADLVVEGLQSLAFIRSRRGAEAVAMMTRDLLREIDPALVDTVASYRAGYLPEERRALEQRLRDGSICAMAATNALELGIDISGLDAVITAGWPGTRASLWQQVGRAGRSGGPALALFVARDDPLDTFIAQHPEAVFGKPVEATVFDPENRYVLAPHLCAAAAEFPLTEEDALRWFGPTSILRLGELTVAGLLRKRPSGWYWTARERASDLADLRGTGGPPVRIVEDGTGRILGSLDSAAAHANLHPGAVYAHQGVTHVVTSLDLGEAVATVVEEEVDYITDAREISDIRITEEQEHIEWGSGTLSFGTVEVTSQVVGFQRRRLITGEYLGVESLDLPERMLSTTAVWWTVSAEQLSAAELTDVDIPGAAHAAEHASIGLLPLFATCDRWDIGGVSTAVHPDTGRATVFVYDGYAGGAGFAEHGFRVARQWLTDTRELIAGCECDRGCPSCIQSPKCGNGNEPLDKAGAVRLLDQLLSG